MTEGEAGASSRSDAAGVSPAGGVQVIRRAVLILRALSVHREGLSLSSIAKEVSLPRSTVHRIVVALEAEGVVVAASPDGGYCLGPEVIRMAYVQYEGVRAELRPLLDELMMRVRETVGLSVLHGDQVTFIDEISAPHSLMAFSGVGRTLPAHSTAAGKALLATLGDDALCDLLPTRLEAQTEQTITSRDQLLEQLAEVRTGGVAFDRQEQTPGISGIATVVRGAPGISASISITVPAERFIGNEKRLVELLQRLDEQ